MLRVGAGRKITAKAHRDRACSYFGKLGAGDD
jgi:hypothetical protein